MRKRITEEVEADEKSEPVVTGELDTIIPQFYKDKAEMDKFKKVADAENKKIKQLMLDANEDTHEAGEYIARRSVSERESLNEDKLIEVLKKHKIPGIIKTKEYVDMNALESYLYHNEMTKSFAADLDRCKTTTEVVTLRVTKKKSKKAE